jgi:predicted acetyltransferase
VAIEIRAARPDELTDFRRVSSYVFAANDDPDSPSEDFTQPEFTTCAFVNGRLAATLGAYPFTMRWNGAPVRTAGVTTVGTYPEYRRRGLLRRMMLHALGAQRDGGEYVAILWASMGAIYQRFGYGLASTNVRYELDPREAALLSPAEPTGEVRLTPKDEAMPDLERIHAEYVAPRNLMLHRVAPMWRHRMRKQDEQLAHVAVYRDGDGRPTGYLLFRTKEVHRPFEPGPDQEMDVRDLVATDVDAYRALWEFVRRHDLVARVTMWPAEDDPAPSLLLEPRALRRRTTDGIWMRLVDVERALPLRPYGEPGALTLRVRDDVCDWNEATFRLETDGPDAQVARTTHHEPDLTLPARALAMLASGHFSATHLARWGQLEARDAAALRLADRMFATEHRPYCPDGF